MKTKVLDTWKTGFIITGNRQQATGNRQQAV